MASFLLVERLQQATSVTSACVLGGTAAALLVPRHDALHTYSLISESEGVPPGLQHGRCFPLQERIERVISVPPIEGCGSTQPDVLALLSDGTVELFSSSTSSSSSSSSSSGAPSSCTLVRQAGCRLSVPAVPEGGMPVTLRPEGPASSSALTVGTAEQPVHVAAAAMHHGYIHIIAVSYPSTTGPSHATSEPQMSAAPVHLLHVGLTGAPPPLQRIGGSSAAALQSRLQQDVHVRAVELLPLPALTPSSAPEVPGASGSNSGPGHSGLGCSKPSRGGTKCHVVLLHQNEGPHPAALNLDCLELDWATGRLSPGPWACRNVHPTTNLLLRFDPRTSSQGQATSTSSAALQPCVVLPAGMLVASSRSLQLFACSPAPPASVLSKTLAEAGGEFAAASMTLAGSSSSAPLASRVRLLDWELPGVPSCAEWLSPTLLVLGDSMAGLHLVGLAGNAASWMRSIQVNGPLSAPSVLCYLPPTLTNAATPVGGGLLFLGSRSGNSQTLQVPPNLLAQLGNGLAPPQASAAAAAAAASGSGSVLQWHLQDPALVKSLAPVQTCITLPDRQRAQDSWLLVGCGAAPCGRLARMRLGVSLRPYMADGPDVPAGVRLFPLRADPSSPHHSHLAFSFDAAGCTDVLLLRGESFTQTSIPGLDASQPSLLLATMPGGNLLQATSSGVRTLPSTSLSASSSPAPGLEWRPPASAGAAAPSLSLAAAKGSWVAVVAGSFLHLLHVDPASGQLQARHAQSLGSSSQVSALALLCLQASPGRVAVQQGTQQAQGSVREDDLHVALGDWSQGSLTLFSLTQLCGAGHGAGGSAEAALKLQLPGGETPRSAACLAASCRAADAGAVGATTLLLLVGTNGGTVLAYELTQAAAAAGASGAWQVAAARQVRISNVAVELQEVDAGAKQTSTPSTGGASAGYVYAHSGCDAIFRLPTAPSSSPSPSLIDGVQVCRVHGSGSLRAVCHLHTDSMPHSMAWVSHEGRLLFGDLEAEQKLRWTTAYIGDTPLHTAYHAASHCLVAVTKDVAGVQWLRLVHADTLQQVLSYRLAAGHYVTSLAVQRLPCSSQQQGGLGAESRDSNSAFPFPGALAAGTAAAGQNGFTDAAPDGSGKEFVVLGSYLLYDGQLDPSLAAGLHRTQGLLSFFEVSMQVIASAAEGGNSSSGKAPASASAAAGASDVRYSLLLHGTCPVPSPCLSLCVATPVWTPASTSGSTTLNKGSSMPGDKGGATRVLGRPTSAAAAAPEQLKGRGAALQPLLLAGGQDGVYALRVHVDDCHTDGERLTRRAAESVKMVEPLPFLIPPPLELGPGGFPSQIDGEAGAGSDSEEQMEAYLAAKMAVDGEEDEEQDVDDDEGDWLQGVERVAGGGEGASFRHAAGVDAAAAVASSSTAGGGKQPRSKRLRRALAAVQLQLRRDWSQHVSLSVAAHTPAFAQAAVTALQPQAGGVVWAGEFLGSVTALQLAVNEVGLALVPAAADRHPVFAQAMAPLSGDAALLAVHPRGLLLVQRNLDEERAFVQQRQQQALSEHEAGVRRPTTQSDQHAGQPGEGSGDGGAGGSSHGRSAAAASAAHPDAVQLLGIKAQDCPALQPLASARPCHSVHRMVDARLGLHLAPVRGTTGAPEDAGAAMAAKMQEAARSNGDVSGAAAAAAAVLCLASDGAVLRVTAMQRSCQAAQALQEVQARLQQLCPAEMQVLTGVQNSGNRHRDTWHLAMDHSGMSEAQVSLPIPGAVAPTDSALPQYSVDGGLIALLAAQAPEVQHQLCPSTNQGTLGRTFTLCSQL